MPRAAKKVAAKKTAESTPPEEAAAKKIIAAIKGGSFDAYLGEFDSALSERINSHIQEQAAAKKTSTSASPAASEKKVAPPPRKTPLVTPEEGVEYKITARLKNLAGATVKFIRFKADSDGSKGIVEMMTDMPGSPKGKRVVVPVRALEEIPKKKPGVKRKSASKKGTKK